MSRRLAQYMRQGSAECRASLAASGGLRQLPPRPTDPLDQGVADIDVPGNPTFNNDPLTVNSGGNNYRYDPLGNLVQDTREQIGSIEWTVAGKVKKVVRTNGSPLPPLEFGYGADGQRIWKENLQSGETTYYIRDAQGNLMATYQATSLQSSLKLTERPIYGSDRLGMDLTPMDLYGLPSLSLNGTVPSNGPAGYRRFELKDHMGNVCVTTTGDRYGVDQVPQDGLIDYSVPKIVGWAGYEAFGSLLPGRNYSSDSYRYLFQGQEHDDEINGGVGTSYAFEYRIHDPRIGRFLSIDPLAAKYAYNSPYAFSENRVIDGVELEGLELGGLMAQKGEAMWNYFTNEVSEAFRPVMKLIDEHVVLEGSLTVSAGVAAEVKLKEASLVDVGAKVNLYSVDLWSGKADFTDPRNPASYSSTHVGDGRQTRVTQGIGITAKEKVFDRFGVEADASHQWQTSSNTLSAESNHQNTSSLTLGYELFNAKKQGPVPAPDLAKAKGEAKGKASADPKACSYCLDLGAKAQLILGVEVNLKVGVK